MHCFLHLQPRVKVEQVRMWETGSEEREGEMKVRKEYKQTKQSLEREVLEEESEENREHESIGGCGIQLRWSMPLTSVVASLLPFLYILFQSLSVNSRLRVTVGVLSSFPASPLNPPPSLFSLALHWKINALPPYLSELLGSGRVLRPSGFLILRNQPPRNGWWRWRWWWGSQFFMSWCKADWDKSS